MLQPSFIKPVLRYLGIAVAALFLSGVAVTLAAYVVVFSGRERIPQVVRQAVRERTGAEVRFDRYRIQLLRHSALIAVALDGVILRDSLARPETGNLLRIRELSLQFHPLKLLQRRLEVTSLLINGGRLRMIRTADGYFNAGFLGRLGPDDERDSSELAFSIDRVQVKAFEVDYEDSLRGKFHRVIFDDSRLRLYREDSATLFRITGNWHFRGLTFRVENGSFLTDKKASVDLSLEVAPHRGRISLLPSHLVIDQDIYQLSGFLHPGKPAYLKLSIAADGLRLPGARSLLAGNLQRALGRYTVEGPIGTQVLIEGPMRPGRPLPARVHFSIQKAGLTTGEWSFSDVALEGRFYQCDSTRPVDPHSGCLAIERFSGRLYDAVPVRGSALVRDLAAPLLQLETEAEADLSRLGRLQPGDLIDSPTGKVYLHARYEGSVDPAGKGMDRLQGRLSLQHVSLRYGLAGLPLQNIRGELLFDREDLWTDGLQLVAGGDSLRIQGRVHRLLPALLGGDGGLYVGLSVAAPRLNIDRLLATPPDTTLRSLAAPPEGDSPGERAGRAIEELLRRMTLDLSVQTDRLRYRKFLGEEVLFRGQYQSECADGPSGGCLKVDTFAATLYDALRLEASGRVSRLEDPLVDLKAALAIPLPRLNELLPERQLHFRQGNARLLFHYEGKLNEYVQAANGRLNGRLEGTVHLENATFDILPRQYAIREGQGRISFDERHLWIDELRLQVNGNDIRANGAIREFLPFVFTRDRPLAVQLQVHSPKIDFSQFTRPSRPAILPTAAVSPASPLLTEVVRSAFRRLEADIWIQAGEVHYRHFHAEDVVFACHYTAHCPHQRELPKEHQGKACFRFDRFQAQLFGAIPLQASLSVHDIDHPFFRVDARVAVPLVRLNGMLPPQRLKMLGGAIDLGFHYEGYFQHPRHSAKGEPAPRLSGRGVIDSAAFDAVARGYRFRDMRLRFAFDQQDLFVEQLRGRLNDNALEANGAFYAFLPFLYAPDQQLRVALDVRSPELDFNLFSAPSRFAERAGETTHEPTRVTEIIEAALNNVEADLSVRLDRVRYRRFSASDISGKLSMAPDSLAFRETVMQLAGGQFRLQGDITGLVNNTPRINVQVGMREADVRRIFFAFDNFGQEGLTYDNLRGKLTADINFRALADSNYDLDPQSIRSHIDLKIVDGALIRLPALMQMNKFIFKNRDMANVRFATLENTFEVRGQQLFIERFDVHSSALTFGVEGQLSFGDRDSTDLLFKVPVSNLFRQDLNEEALDDREDRPLGLSILLRATERDGRLRMRWVLSRPRD